MRNRMAHILLVALFLVSPVGLAGDSPSDVTPATPTIEPTDDVKLKIRSKHGKFQLFTGPDLGKPASRQVGKSPDPLTVHCRAQASGPRCVGTTDKKGAYLAGDCLVLALDKNGTELVLSGDSVCENLMVAAHWSLELDLSEGTVLAVGQPRPRPKPGIVDRETPRSDFEARRSAHERDSKRRVSLVPSRFMQKLADNHARRTGKRQ